METKELLKEFIPPILLRGLRHIAYMLYRPKSDYTYCSEGWPHNYNSGWNTQSVVEAYMTGWDDFIHRLESSGPWDLKEVDSQTSINDVVVQNMKLVFTHSLMRAAYGHPELKILDWGGGIGHYYLIARNALPELALNWTIMDLPLLCESGKELLPQVRFTSSSDDAFAACYDFVFASSSLQYALNWRQTVHNLAQVTKSWLLITRHPVCHQSNDYVVVQRSYGTTYPGWVCNRNEFLHFMEQDCKLKLVHEFLISPGSKIDSAPDASEQRGFLFHKEIPC